MKVWLTKLLIVATAILLCAVARRDAVDTLTAISGIAPELDSALNAFARDHDIAVSRVASSECRAGLLGEGIEFRSRRVLAAFAAKPPFTEAFVGGLAIQFSSGRALDEDAEPYLRRHGPRNQGKGFNYVSLLQALRPTGAVFAKGRYWGICCDSTRSTPIA